MRAILLLALALSACAGQPSGPAAAVPEVTSWRSLATPGDRKRLRDWRSVWVAALAKARVANGADVAAEGDLLMPDTPALDGITPPAGEYRCRVLKLGGRTAGMLDFVAYPAFTCRIGAGAGPAASAAPSGPGDSGAIDFLKA